jgi:hypothetical protein
VKGQAERLYPRRRWWSNDMKTGCSAIRFEIENRNGGTSESYRKMRIAELRIWRVEARRWQKISKREEPA